MRAPCRHGEAVESCGTRRGKIAVGNAAGEDVDQIEAEPGGKGFGMIEERSSGASLLIGGAPAPVASKAGLLRL